MTTVKKGEMMERQQGQREKSLAWFKLADLIARGEREKALSVFRLLAHSLPDRAYVLQLEGDILWYLDDRISVEKYKQAAFLYQKEKRWVDAIAIYEHLLTQKPQSYEAFAALIGFYATIDWQEKFQERLAGLTDLFNDCLIDESQLEKAIKDVLQIVHMVDDRSTKSWLYDYLVAWNKKLPEQLSDRFSALWGLEVR